MLLHWIDNLIHNKLVPLNRQFDYFNSISSSKDTKPFWKECKPYLPNKLAVGDSKLMFIESDNIILDNESVFEEFNNLFSQIVDSLDLYEFPSEPLMRLTILCQNSKLSLALLKLKNNLRPKLLFLLVLQVGST